MKYKSSQTGWIVMSLLLGVLVLLTLSVYKPWGNNPIPLTPYLIIAGVFILLILLFYRMTLEIDYPRMKIQYGIGLIRFTFCLDHLQRVEIIHTPWYYGLGIRITPKGMLYNIQGSGAVRIFYQKNGKNKSFMVGTPNPEELKEVLDRIHELLIIKNTS